MSRLYKRADSSYYWWTSRYKGRRLRKSTKMSNKHLAVKIQAQWDLSLMTGDLDFLGLANQSSSRISEFFTHYLSLRSRKSDKTYRTSKGMINRFKKFLNEKNIISIKEITVKILDDYIEYLECSSKTKKNHILEISQMLNQAIKEGLILNNPAKGVTFPTIIKKEIHRPLDDADLKVIFADSSGWSLYYQMLLHTGLRAGDVAMLKYGNIDRRKRAIISMVRKSRRIHEFPLSHTILNQIPENQSDDPIFPDLYSENEIVLNGNLKKPRLYLQAILKLGNRKKATLHSFRVTFNNNLRNLGLGIEDRQKLLAHSSSETTKIYTHPNFDLALSYIDQLPDYNEQIKRDQNVTKT